MFKFILYDDQEYELNVLAEYVRKACVAKNIEFKINKYLKDESVIEYAADNKGRRNIYLLDILSQDGTETGLRIAEAIRRQDNTAYIVFVSGHPEYILLSFKKQPFDFILKPYESNTIKDLVERIQNHFDTIHNETNPYFFLHSGHISNKIHIKDITFCEKENNVLVIHTLKGVFRGYMSFKDVLSVLSKYGFMVCHKSYIVNPVSANIEHILKAENKIVFKNKEVCYISRKYKKGFLNNVVRII